MKAWRVCAARYAATAFSGEGAAKFPGRWNSAGRPMIYLAESRALAGMEILVHIEDVSLLSAMAWVAIPAEFGDALIGETPRLPRDWRAIPAAQGTRRLGDRWLESNASVVLRVPSVTIQGEFNYIVNPRHPDYARLHIGHPEPFHFDARLGQSRR